MVPGRNIVPKPAERSWEECAAYPLATLTAWRMLRRARVRAGESVLIVGIGGGVSTAALALAVRMGAVVHATSREQAKQDRAVELSLPRLFFKQIEVIGSTTGSYEEFADVVELVGQGLPVHVDEVFDLADYPAALEPVSYTHLTLPTILRV